MSLVDDFEQQRGRLIGLAYRMLGSRADAEDVVQDAWLRWQGAPRDQVEDASAFLTRIVTRLCLDQLKSARATREQYVGTWLPEPVLDAGRLVAHDTLELADDLSFCLLLALDRLSPLERAAFLLHDVFGAPFAQVATALERTPEACRQLAARARRAIRKERRAPAASEEHARLLAAFLQAVGSGDASALADLLATAVVAHSDGGGLVAAARRPIVGADRVARFLLGIYHKHLEDAASLRVEMTALNGRPGALLFLDGRLDSAIALEVGDGVIRALYFVRNPDKLRLLAAGISVHSGEGRDPVDQDAGGRGAANRERSDPVSLALPRADYS